MTHDDEIVIASRFRGPAGSGNGGYVCGRVSAYVEGVPEVTLCLPPPLDRPLAVRRTGGGGVQVFDGTALVAEATPATVGLTPPPPVDPDTAAEAMKGYPGWYDHPFPTCFVCGPDADGLRVTPGPVEGRDVVAALWTPDAGLSDAAGVVREEFVWAALDCPGAWALDIGPGRPMVLGRLAARLDAPVHAGQAYVVVGWPIAEAGRKLYSGTAIYDGAAVCAVASATWIRSGR